jgi:hypothetical protein
MSRKLILSLLVILPGLVFAGQAPAAGGGVDIFAILGIVTGAVAVIMGNPWIFVSMAASGLNIAILAPICFVLALIFGIVAVVRMKKDPGRFKAEKLAWWGLILPGVTVTLWLLAFLLSAI